MSYFDPNNEIVHYGVLGMKWGVRKDRSRRQDNAGKGKKASAKKIQKLDKKFETMTSRRWMEWHNDAAKDINKQLQAFNADPRWKGLSGPEALAKAGYYDAAAKMSQKAFEASAKRMGMNASGTKKMTVKVVRDPRRVSGGSTLGEDYATGNLEFRLTLTETTQAERKKLKHDSVADGDKVFRIIGLVNKKGFITGVQDPEDEDSLAHYGVLGMKWGVRKDRRKSGTSASSKVRKAAAKTRGAAKKVRKNLDASKTEEHIRARTLRKKPASNLTSNELRFLNERLRLEQEYDRLQKAQIREGVEFVNNLLATATLAGEARKLIKNR